MRSSLSYPRTSSSSYPAAINLTRKRSLDIFLICCCWADVNFSIFTATVNQAYSKSNIQQTVKFFISIPISILLILFDSILPTTPKCHGLWSLKITTNRYQDFSYNITHSLYTRNIKYTMKRHRKSNKKHTHTVLSLDSSSNQHDTSSLAESSSVTAEFSCSSSG